MYLKCTILTLWLHSFKSSQSSLIITRNFQYYQISKIANISNIANIPIVANIAIITKVFKFAKIPNFSKLPKYDIANIDKVVKIAKLDKINKIHKCALNSTNVYQIPLMYTKIPLSLTSSSVID